MIDQKKRDQIWKFIHELTDQADRHFGDPSIMEPLERRVGRGDESLEYSRFVCEGAKIGLRQDLPHLVVNAQIDDEDYLFTFERQ
ncbi:hypothetical protein GEV41_11055 [Pseudomonas putida]|uniref:hypothetical protein n=1 Tax=Pseudomonas putida group TaxID=136845 RepID=UPI00156FDE34|nr:MULTISPECIES: hypothetical protein [Pseudomonas putida group]MCE0992058.1 hypothetical protein [Pseudomonas alloputida]QKL06933.1 hypothetical protein GEV41_11055 [Pseudomonas putida]WNI10621.1 hypothetical protein RIF00_11845 [Pseudomonas putida]